MKKSMWIAFILAYVLVVTPVLTRAEANTAGNNADESRAPLCKIIITIVRQHPELNLTVPPQCSPWDTGITQQQCVTLKANLRIGDRGERVRILHQMLVRAGYGPFTSDEFTEKTAEAVVGFQEQYRSEVLTPNGLVRGTGYVGVSTRAKLNALFGCGTIPPVEEKLSLRISSGPTSLKVNEEGTWRLEVKTPNSQDYRISVSWGDEVAMPVVAASAEKSAINIASFTHRYASSGTYAVTFRLSSGSQTRAVTRKVQVNAEGTENKITVISPNGGETWQIGETRTVSWQAEKAGKVSLWLNPNTPCEAPAGVVCTAQFRNPIRIVKNLPSKVGVNTYAWRIAKYYYKDTEGYNESLSNSPLRSEVVGKHYMRICANSTEDKGCGESNAPFKIILQTITNRVPSITSVSGPSSLAVGSTGTWQIRATDPDGEWLNYSILWGDETVADTQAAGSAAGSTITQRTSFTHHYAHTGTYTVKITVSDSSGAIAQSTLSVVVQN